MPELGDLLQYGSRQVVVAFVVPPGIKPSMTSWFREAVNDYWLGDPWELFGQSRLLESYLVHTYHKVLAPILYLPEKRVTYERPILFWPDARSLTARKERKR